MEISKNDNSQRMMTYAFRGRFGNNCLQIYKVFEGAARLKVPFQNIVLDERSYTPMFENIKSNFRSRDEISKIQFTVVRNSQKLEDDPPPGNIRFERYGWIYPNTPAEMQLFNWLFDPPSLRQSVYDAYKEIFDKPTVGFTIRRGDFRRLRHSHRFMTDSEAAETAHTLQKLHQNNVRFVVSSDELDCVKDIFNGLDAVFVQDKPENTVMLLSFCDYIVNNGTLSRSADRLTGKYESTFGQIAQCLCVSRHFAQLQQMNDALKCK